MFFLDTPHVLAGIIEIEIDSGDIDHFSTFRLLSGAETPWEVCE